MTSNRNKIGASPRLKTPKIRAKGLPEITDALSQLHFERRIEAVSTKIETTLQEFFTKNAEPSASAFVREAILEKLQREKGEKP